MFKKQVFQHHEDSYSNDNFLSMKSLLCLHHCQLLWLAIGIKYLKDLSNKVKDHLYQLQQSKESLRMVLPLVFFYCLHILLQVHSHITNWPGNEFNWKWFYIIEFVILTFNYCMIYKYSSIPNYSTHLHAQFLSIFTSFSDFSASISFGIIPPLKLLPHLS